MSSWQRLKVQLYQLAGIAGAAGWDCKSSWSSFLACWSSWLGLLEQLAGFAVAAGAAGWYAGEGGAAGRNREDSKGIGNKGSC